MSALRRAAAVLGGLSLLTGGLAAVTTTFASANPAGTDLVISEVYGGGGNSGATLTHDFIELYNPTDAAIPVEGLSVQYRSGGGTGSGFTNLTGSVQPGRHYLIQQAQGSGGTTALPTPEATGSLAMAASAGSVALVRGTGTVTPTAANTLDLVGFGSATLFETAPTPAPSNTSSVSRDVERTDRDNNSADFTTGAPDPQNSTVAWPPGEEPPPTPTERTIAEIQGTGPATPLAGETVTTRGVVTAAYPTGEFFAFVIQTEGTGSGEDATPDASDAVWVYQTTGGVDAAEGQYVEVTGVVAERFDRTQLTYDPTSGSLEVLDEEFSPVTPLSTEWFATETEREAHESELVDLSGQAFTVTNNYATNRFGEIGLAAGGTPLITPTEVANPESDPAGYQATIDDNVARGVVLDDGADWDYQSDAFAQDAPLPWIDRETTASVGAAAQLTAPVIVDYGFGDWRLQPTSQVNGPAPALITFEDARSQNTRPAAVGGDLQLATFNVLNYFNTTGMDYVASGAGTCTYFRDRDGDEVTNNRCDPNGPRGAAEDDDLERQQAKIVTAINALDASVVSLEEIENSAAFGEDRDDALSALTGALNQAAGDDRWAFVPSPPVDERPASEDVIRTAFIYDPSTVELVGDSVIYDGPAFSNARQPLAQAFTAAGSDDPQGAFAVIVNHFKSKGSACTGEPEGPQGNCNESRVEQARALAGFADDFAADRGLEQVFLTGDFNSYTEEDPMLVLEEAGFTQLKSDTASEWSYSFDGMSGSLDHVLANEAALGNVTGVDIWEINATEALAYEYSRFNYNVTDFYAADVFRASDHNPEIVGIDVPAPREKVDLDIDLKPGKVEAGKTRPRLEVEVEDDDNRRRTVSGVVRVSFEDEVRTETLDRGEALFELGTFDTPGPVTVTVTYLGSATHAPRTETFTFEVRSRKHP